MADDDPRVVKYLQSLDGGDDPRAPEHAQFGNNFYLIFVDMERDPSDILYEACLDRTKNTGLLWYQFTIENSALVGDIRTSLLEIANSY